MFFTPQYMYPFLYTQAGLHSSKCEHVKISQPVMSCHSYVIGVYLWPVSEEEFHGLVS